MPDQRGSRKGEAQREVFLSSDARHAFNPSVYVAGDKADERTELRGESDENLASALDLSSMLRPICSMPKGCVDVGGEWRRVDVPGEPDD